mmetsp:Transcript_2508/g.5510  ORF Transcript_2508/g.5510 Transcript_2508/m.5510 type:complete len:590 (-) Transcript_2508:204-1973(-)
MDADAAAANAENGGEPAMPQYFGSYEVLKTIGKGKFAVVYRAKKIGDDQVVALKRIAVDMMNDKAREKCLKEVRLLQSLDHPNIVRYMDSFICENDLMIVYEWAAAGDLKRQLRKAQERGTGFEERVIWKYFSQICNAMQHMHERRIMHRDLKPANIFLTLDGTIKVGDLGLSRELSEHTIQAHSKVGTPLYMSPEVLKGEGYDFKSDIWSLGCLLYELAMLKSPFKSEGLNLYSLFQKISHGDFTPLPENFSEELRNLAYSMISTKSEDRPEIGDVCKIAQEMRTLTADKAARKKSARADNANSAKSRGATPVEASTKLEPSVRPVMGVADSKPEARRQDQGQGQKQKQKQKQGQRRSLSRQARAHAPASTSVSASASASSTAGAPTSTSTTCTASTLDAGTAWNALVCNDGINLVNWWAQGVGADLYWPPNQPRNYTMQSLVPLSLDFCAFLGQAGLYGAPSKGDVWAEWLDTVYGGTRIQYASNIVFSNGDLDPWSPAGVQARSSGDRGGGRGTDSRDSSRDSSTGNSASLSNDGSVVSLSIAMGGHHLDLFWPTDSDPQSVREVRAVERQHVQRWIDQVRERAGV